MAGKRNDSHSIELRRKKVFKLRMMGIMIPGIAESLQVSTDTIYDDLTWLRKEAKNIVTDFDEKIDIGLFLRKMQELEEMYMGEYIKAGKIRCQNCKGTGNIILENEEGEKKVECNICDGKGTYEDTKVKIVIIDKIQQLNVDVAKVKTEIGLWTEQKRVVDDKSFEILIVEASKERGLLPEPIETVTEKKIRIAKIEKKKEEESVIAKKIREMKSKSKGGSNK